ncbi:IS66 family insertion sequence element accessory protein TnpB [Alkalicoccus urumqiensis]|uniref:Transposase n=1 Tax=Alkalicoccus urumqiensis TaxID=1548213 RepID=A0A2P6MI23_ALKUR|nr:hypothetical protein C6I21_06445 [Alkalicoccus urumqiensis]
MIPISSGKHRIFLAHGDTGMRLGIDGISALVQERFQLDPFQSDLFYSAANIRTGSRFFIR